jgi:hypothetical protein
MYMIALKNMITSETGKIFMSIILGFGLSSLFSKVCNERNCLVFYGKDPSEIKDKIYKTDNKCHTYKLVNTSCNKQKKIIQIA